jgi:hypothetical protein
MEWRGAWVLVFAAGVAISACDTGIATEAIQLAMSGKEMTLEVSGTTRREALARILGDSDTEVEWLSETLAQEVVNGVYHGTIDKIVPELLSRSNFIISYDNVGGELRMTRIVVVGPISSKTSVAESTPPVQPVKRVRSKHVKIEPTANTDERRKLVREMMLEKMRANGDAIGKRVSALPSGRRPTQTQPIARGLAPVKLPHRA